MKKLDSKTATILRLLGVTLLFAGLISGGLYVTARAVNRLVQTLSATTTTTTTVTTNPSSGQAVDFPVEDLPAPLEETSSSELKPRTIDLSEENATLILLYGPIMLNGNHIAELIKAASKDKKPIYLLIDSPGGSVISGGAIVSAIEASTVPVYTVCLQICASMAAMIHQYGTKRYMVDRSILMFHNASGGFQGSLPQVASLFNTMNRFVNKMFLHAARRSNQSLKDFIVKIEHELWIDAEDSLAQQYSDETISIIFSDSDALNPPNSFVNEQRQQFKEKMKLMDIQ